MQQKPDSSFQPLEPAHAVFDASGHLYREPHDACYRGAGDPWRRAHDLFLRGNGLPARWADRQRFTVLQTGFGAGIDFLALWRAWRADPARPGRLHVVAIDERPFDRAGLCAALARLGRPDDVGTLSEALIDAWPPRLPGLHRLDFENGAVTLTLAFGSLARVAPELQASVDAFFFDALTLSHEPADGTRAAMKSLAGLAAEQASAASAASGDAACGMLAQAGFAVRRHTANADSPAMITATRNGGAPDAGAPQSGALVVGGGLAGAGVARALAERGVGVTVLERSGLATPHDGHGAAALTPLISRDDDMRARLSRAGSLSACRRWEAWAGTAAFQRCGTVQLARDDERAAKWRDALEQLQFPSDWVRYLSAAEASAIAGVALARDALYFPGGMQVDPAALIAGLMAHGAVRRQSGNVASVRRAAGQWQALDAGGQVLAAASGLVLANSAGTPALLAASGLAADLSRLGQMHALAGEVTMLPQAALEGGPRCIVAGEGYLLPAVAGFCTAGSTYVHGASETGITAAGQHVNLGKAAGLLGREAASFGLEAGSLPGWAGWRAVMPGRLPCVGRHPHAPALWIASAYASHGLSWSALAGELIAAQWCAEPLPVEIGMAAAIAPR